MPVYKWVAVNRRGRTVKGDIEAANERIANFQLKRRNASSGGGGVGGPYNSIDGERGPVGYETSVYFQKRGIKFAVNEGIDGIGVGDIKFVRSYFLVSSHVTDKNIIRSTFIRITGI